MDLIACSSCARQFDVTHLTVNDRVRCMCDAVLMVPARGPLSVSALACSHCGGTVRPDDMACPYCEAKLDEKDRLETTLCPMCFARIPDNANHCSGCGVVIQPQALEPIPDGKDCPRCKGELRIRSLGISDVIECSECNGLWIRAGVFDAICRDAERRLESSVVEDPGGEKPSPESTIQYIPCLQCGQLMNRRQYRHGGRASGVVVDMCRNHGIWLDNTELEHVVAFIRRNHGGDSPTSAGVDALERKSGAPAKPRERISMETRQSPLSPLVEALEFIADMLIWS